MTHEDYVSFKQAKDLKELGFDWECNRFYNSTLNEDINGWLSCENFNNSDYSISAPTLAQAQKWLREEKKIDVIVFLSYPRGERKYHYGIHRQFPFLNYVDDYHHDTYELALSAGIDKALELLKEENK